MLRINIFLLFLLNEQLFKVDSPRKTQQHTLHRFPKKLRGHLESYILIPYRPKVSNGMQSFWNIQTLEKANKSHKYVYI